MRALACLRLMCVCICAKNVMKTTAATHELFFTLLSVKQLFHCCYTSNSQSVENSNVRTTPPAVPFWGWKAIKPDFASITQCTPCARYNQGKILGFSNTRFFFQLTLICIRGTVPLNLYPPPAAVTAAIVVSPLEAWPGRDACPSPASPPPLTASIKVRSP